MLFNAGRLHEHGVIVGRYGHGAMYGKGRLLIEQVYAALLQHHDPDLHLKMDTYAEVGYLGRNEMSAAAVSNSSGTLIRVLNGAGYLSINGERLDAQALDYGDWAFIPPGLTYTMTSVIVEGMNLMFATVTLEPR